MIHIEQFGDEWYITAGDLLYGRIVDMDCGNYYIIWEDDEMKIPLHGFDSVERYVKKHYKEHEPI